LMMMIFSWYFIFSIFFSLACMHDKRGMLSVLFDKRYAVITFFL
jgi:hypothetical protein